MKTRSLERSGLAGLLLGLAVILGGCPAVTAPRVEPLPISSRSGDARLAALLEAVRVEQGLPALAAALIAKGRLAAVAVVGLREYGRPALVSAADKFMIGSCSKALTATLAGILVQDGLIDWSSTLSQVFPGLEMRPEYRAITLEQLLSHRAGLATNYKGGRTTWQIDYEFDPHRPGDPMSHRLQHLENTVRLPLAFPPGTRVHYSNAGYLIAAAMLEKTAGKPFEELLAGRLFRPLGITSAGYGPPAALEPGRRPWGHYWDQTSRTFKAYKAELNNFMAPAGHQYLSLADWAKFILLHLGVQPPGKPLLSQATLDRLHHPPDTVRWDIDIHLGLNYALGWFTKTSAKGHRLLWHGGRGFDFNAQVVADLAAQSAVLVVSTGERPDIHPQTQLLRITKKIREAYRGTFDLPSII